MKSYIMSVAVTSVISAVMNIITPEKWSKYVGIVTGLVVTICISRPIIALVDADIFNGMENVSNTVATDSEQLLKGEIKNELENRIEEDIEVRLKTEFGLCVMAEVGLRTNENAEILGVEKVVLYGDKLDAVVIGRIREVYRAEEVKYAGTEKTLEKTE